MSKDAHPLRWLWRRFGGICALCREPCDLADATRDHVIPKTLGGAMSTWNLRLAHSTCNQVRSDVFPFGTYLGMSAQAQQQAWQRDGGRCAGCGSSRFLVFSRNRRGRGSISAKYFSVRCVDCHRELRKKQNARNEVRKQRKIQAG